jgi:hypothetical protein
MSNEMFFLKFVVAEFVDLHNEEAIIENSLRVYYFRHCWSDGTSSEYKIRFNQIGGFVDYEEVDS